MLPHEPGAEAVSAEEQAVDREWLFEQKDHAGEQRPKDQDRGPHLAHEVIGRGRVHDLTAMQDHAPGRAGEVPGLHPEHLHQPPHGRDVHEVGRAERPRLARWLRRERLPQRIPGAEEQVARPLPATSEKRENQRHEQDRIEQRNRDDEPDIEDGVRGRGADTERLQHGAQRELGRIPRAEQNFEQCLQAFGRGGSEFVDRR